MDGGRHGGNGAVARAPTTRASVALTPRWCTRVALPKCPPQAAGELPKTSAILHKAHYAHDLNNRNCPGNPRQLTPRNLTRGYRLLTLAAIDRLVHHATILEMNVESYRRKAALNRKRGKGD